MKIRRILIDEVVVPARADSVNSPELERPLHMLPHAGRPAWSIQFDKLAKLLIRIEIESGVVGCGEFYRNVAASTVNEIARGLLGTHLQLLNPQSLPLPAGRLYDGF